MDLITVIIPVYNVEKYLEQCVESIVNQTYKNLEIILINDGSTDSSGKLCDILVKRDIRIKVIHKKNEGLGLARNTGLEYVNGKYVTFIDSDDYADSDLIEKLYVSIKENNADTCIGGFKRVNNDGEIIYEERYKSVVYENEEIMNGLLSRMLGSSPEKSDAIRMSVWNVLYSTEIIKNNSLKFPSEREYISEDIIFDIEYYRKSQRCCLIDSCSYNYRVNNISLTKSYKKDRFEKSKFLYNEVVNRIEKYRLGDRAITRLQRQYFVNVKYCIKQERVKISKLSINDSFNNIKKICDDNQLKNIIKNYPKRKLGLKQQVFLLMIEKNQYGLLYLSAILNIL